MTPAEQEITRQAEQDRARYGEPIADENAALAAAHEQVHRGQARMAYRLARTYRDRLVHVHELGWFAWDGQRWAYDNTGAAKRAVLAVLRDAWNDAFDDKELQRDVRRCESSAGVAGVLDLAAALAPFAVTVDDLDANRYLLNTPAGTLDLRTAQVHQHDPGDLITKVTGGSYRPGIDTATWDKFLTRVLPGVDVREYLQRLVGVALLGKVVEHVLPIMTGTGANGKSTLIGAVNQALGDYAVTAEPDLFMHRENAHPTGEMDLRGARWVVVSESDKNRRLAEATVKRLTGGDRVRARRMRKDFVEFAPSHLAVLATNHLPRVSGDDPAIWRRLRVLPFSVTIPEDERDPHLPDQLCAEVDGILTWAVEGYREYADRGLADPEPVRVATDRYQADSDAIARFIAECCLINPHMYATTGDLFERWSKWREVDGAELMSRKAFGQALDRHGFVAGPGGRAGRRRQGIGLAAEDDDDGPD